MKNFKLSFCHPIKGILKLFKPGANCAAYQIAIDTEESENLNVLLTEIPKGDWNLVLDWEYEERSYSYQRNILVSY